jgi:Family of unknown function (DUF5771)
MAGSLPFDEKKGCPGGYIKRKSYTSRAGHRVPPRCIRSTSGLNETRKNFVRRTLGRQTARLKAVHGAATTRKKCPAGQIVRRGYVRKFATSIQKKGYTVRRKTGKVYRIYPEKESVYVRPGCVKDRGLPGKLAPGQGFGPLKKGDLKKHGYIYHKKADDRHAAIKKAVKEFGALGVYRRLDAVAKLSKRTVPEASKVFSVDRDWLKSHYELKAF